MNNEECLKACLDCMEACNACYDACLSEEDLKMMVPCIRLDRECADIPRIGSKSYSIKKPIC